MRFVWTKVSDDRVLWEQAYFLPEVAAWKANWTMDITRVD